MHIRRFLRHALMNPVRERRAFPKSTLDAIQREIADHEKHHRGQIVFVVEAELSTAHLWRHVDSRARARQVFASHDVWNTEENNGVLIYLLLADHRVEIVADRGVDARVQPHEWHAVCRMMEAHFAKGEFEAGAIAGIRAVSELLARHFPGRGAGRNELPDRPVLI